MRCGLCHPNLVGLAQRSAAAARLRPARLLHAPCTLMLVRLIYAQQNVVTPCEGSNCLDLGCQAVRCPDIDPVQ